MRLLRLSAAGAAAAGALLDGATVAEAGPGAGLLARRIVDAGMAGPVPPDGAGPSAGLVTVAVPVRDRAADLARLLAAIGPCGEVVVVDDGSSDGSGDVARRAGARVVRHARPLGPGPARASAAAAARLPFVAFVDSDVLPGPGWLDRLLPHLADPAVAAVAPRVASAPGHVLLDRYEQARSPLDLGPRGGRILPGSRLSYVPAAVLLIRRELVAFDHDLRFGEDVDLVWRLVEAGWTVRYEPASTVTHRPRSSWTGWTRQRVGYGSSAAPLARRHPGPLRPLAGSAGAVATWAVGAVDPALGAAALGFATGRLARRLGPLVASSLVARGPLVAPGPLDSRGPLVAASLVARSHLHAMVVVADTVRRTWLPLVPLAGRHAPGLLAASMLPLVGEWWTARPDVGLPSYLWLRMADDAAYCAGVWWGCARERTLLPVVPSLPVPSLRRPLAARRTRS